MKNKTICIVTPIYKPFESLSVNEVKSLEQCLNILYNYNLIFVAPASLECSGYLDIAKTYGVSANLKRFNSSYFRNTKGYNSLLLSVGFYSAFRMFEYILIYQLDAWVFRDELEYWCSKGYDYVGAPWFKGYDGGNSKSFLGVGNGGFSMRKVASVLKVLHTFKYIESPTKILKEKLKNSNSFLSYAKAFLVFLLNASFKNNNFYIINDFRLNEDLFWGSITPQNFSWYKVAPIEQAMQFSFEMNPSYLFELNNNQLPMGCHAWWRFDLEFWKPHLEKSGFKL